MELEYLKEFVGNLAVLTTILQFLSGALVCKQYVANKTTGETSSLPFVCCALSCSLWLLYGILKVDDKIILVNAVGVALMIGYILLFYVFTFKKSLVIKQSLGIVIIFLIVMGFITNQDDKAVILNVTGMVASFFTLAAISSPMSKLFYVMKVKNTECLPFPMILMSFIVSSLWFLYGYIIQDSFIVCVNLIGTFLAVAQLSLFCIYPAAPLSPLLPKNI